MGLLPTSGSEQPHPILPETRGPRPVVPHPAQLPSPGLQSQRPLDLPRPSPGCLPHLCWGPTHHTDPRARQAAVGVAVALTGDAATQEETFDIPVIARGTFLGVRGALGVRRGGRVGPTWGQTGGHVHRSDPRGLILPRGWHAQPKPHGHLGQVTTRPMWAGTFFLLHTPREWVFNLKMPQVSRWANDAGEGARGWWRGDRAWASRRTRAGQAGSR